MKTKNTKLKPRKDFDNLVQSLSGMGRSMQVLARQAEAQYAIEVEDVIETKSRDIRHIEHLLDGMLGFCCDPAMLVLYKKLCRYYYKIDPAATVSYVQFYREMWDGDKVGLKKKKKK